MMNINIYREKRGTTELLGVIRREGADRAFFAYDDAYLDSAMRMGELGVSERLPLSDVGYAQDDFAPFFQGLLPEGETLGALAQMLQVARNAYLSLLERLGCETIGALTFSSAEVGPGYFERRYGSLKKGVVRELAENPVRAIAEELSSTRLSLAGAQSKTAWFLPADVDMECASPHDWLVPEGGAPSSHIVKVARRGEENIALNELACSLLSCSCGIETARVCMVPAVPGAIAVERYDRLWVDDARGGRKLARLHQEDFCQALGLHPALKYQPEGIDASYLALVGDLIDAVSEHPFRDRVEFAKRLVFNYAVGNTDAHLKNSSFLYNADWTARRLSPLYDVTCIPLTGYSTKMPFVVGEHRDLDEIDARDIMSIALDLDIDLSSLDAVVREVVDGISASGVATHDEELRSMMRRILDSASSRVKVLEDFLG